ncbi:toll/interleukin-1 receptor domain-containing protein [Aquihabitans daechungensis]|uniref:toll/interleukin-1 receptor domain-containing protein n=1 Tax=Aquihabitans daechungensis TaxID=1052257 RepID=UPI003BA07223
MDAIFISHDSADAKTAQSLVASLESEHLPCWIAPRDIPAGANYGDAISDAITTAGALVFLLSHESINSQFCKKEVEYGASVGTTLVPVRLDGTELAGGLRFFLAGNQWVEASASDDWVAEVATALAHLRIDGPGAASASQPGTPPPAAQEANGAPPAVRTNHGTIAVRELSVLDCRSLLASMKFLRDPRNAPEGRRRGRFKAGWRSAVAGRIYADRTLEELKWDNLGWRLGGRFGEQPDDVMDTVFELFATLWHEGHA